MDPAYLRHALHTDRADSDDKALRIHTWVVASAAIWCLYVVTLACFA